MEKGYENKPKYLGVGGVILIMVYLGYSKHSEKKPVQVIIDFELATMNALRKVYPGVKVTGCLYHFQTNLFKNIMKKYPSCRQNEHSQKTFELVKTLVFVY